MLQRVYVCSDQCHRSKVSFNATPVQDSCNTPKKNPLKMITFWTQAVLYTSKPCCANTHAQTHTRSLSQTRTQTHTLSLPHIHTHAHKCARCLSRTRICKLAESILHTNRPQAHTHTISLSHTHLQVGRVHIGMPHAAVFVSVGVSGAGMSVVHDFVYVGAGCVWVNSYTQMCSALQCGEFP